MKKIAVSLALVLALGRAIPELDSVFHLHLGASASHDCDTLTPQDHHHGDADDHHHGDDGQCHHQTHCCCTHVPATLALEQPAPISAFKMETSTTRDSLISFEPAQQVI